MSARTELPRPFPLCSRDLGPGVESELLRPYFSSTFASSSDRSEALPALHATRPNPPTPLYAPVTNGFHHQTQLSLPDPTALDDVNMGDNSAPCLTIADGIPQHKANRQFQPHADIQLDSTLVTPSPAPISDTIPVPMCDMCSVSITLRSSDYTSSAMLMSNRQGFGSNMEEIPTENVAHLKQVSPEEIGDGQEEVIEKMDPAIVEMFGSTSDIASGQEKGDQNIYSECLAESGIRNVPVAGVQMPDVNSTDKAELVQHSQAVRRNVTEGSDPKLVGPVCKRWSSISISATFQRACSQISLFDPWFLMVDHELNQSIRFDTSEGNWKNLIHPAGFNQVKRIAIASCDGLVCFRHTLGGFEVCNPVTGTCHKLPFPDLAQPLRAVSMSFDQDSSFSFYSVILVSSELPNLSFRMFSSDKNNWEEEEICSFLDNNQISECPDEQFSVNTINSYATTENANDSSILRESLKQQTFMRARIELAKHKVFDPGGLIIISTFIFSRCRASTESSSFDTRGE